MRDNERGPIATSDVPELNITPGDQLLLINTTGEEVLQRYNTTKLPIHIFGFAVSPELKLVPIKK